MSFISCSNWFCNINEDQRLRCFLEESFEHHLQNHPEEQSALGLKKGKDSWNNFSQISQQKEYVRLQKTRKKLLTFDKSQLSEDSLLSRKVFKNSLEHKIEEFQFRFHRYPVNQLFGRHSHIVSFLKNFHSIESIPEAYDYIARVRGIKKNFDQLIEHLKKSEGKGIIPPRAVFPQSAEQIKNLLKGFPIENQDKDHILLEDFKRKISVLKLSPIKREKLIEELSQVLTIFYRPGYQNLLDYWLSLYKKSDTQDGVWKHPDGDKFYVFKLRQNTTTSMTPEEVHQLGLREVKRLHEEITDLKNKIGFKGSLKDFFNDFRNNKKFYYEKGENYIKDTKSAFLSAQKILPDYFGILPKHSLQIKQVEKFREKSAGSAFYHRPSNKTLRPAIFYINLYNLKEHPKYGLKALTFHETVPGHHLQISIALGLKKLPRFQRYLHFTAFTEGWALYSEKLARDMGLYQDDYEYFGQLSKELMRACRLVVDTALHYKKWSREQAIDYLIQNSDSSYEGAARSIDRYIVNPAQATAYMIGSLKIQELKKLAEKKLGEKFDIKDFHDQVLKNGALPLNILEENIYNWLSLP